MEHIRCDGAFAASGCTALPPRLILDALTTYNLGYYVADTATHGTLRRAVKILDKSIM